MNKNKNLRDKFKIYPEDSKLHSSLDKQINFVTFNSLDTKIDLFLFSKLRIGLYSKLFQRLKKDIKNE